MNTQRIYPPGTPRMIGLETFFTATCVVVMSCVLCLLGVISSTTTLPDMLALMESTTSTPAAEQALAQTAQTLVEENRDMQWMAVTLLGGLLASIMAFYRKQRVVYDTDGKPIVEGRQVVSRFIGAVISSVLLPRIATLIYPPFKDWAIDPILLAGAGFMCGLFGFFAAPALMDKLSSRAPEIVNDEFEHRFPRNRNAARRRTPMEPPDEDPPTKL